MKLESSLQAWHSSDHQTTDFKKILIKEVCSLDSNLLPLQQGLSHSSYAIGDNLAMTILKIDDDKNNIIIKAGLFYSGIIAGCSCSDDPTPTDVVTEYCDVLFKIDKQTADTVVSLVE